MGKDRNKIKPRRLRGMVSMQLQQSVSVTIAQLGAATAWAIVMPPIAILKEMRYDLQCLDLVRKAKPVDVEASDTRSPVIPLSKRVNAMFFPVAIAIAIGNDEVGHEPS